MDICCVDLYTRDKSWLHHAATVAVLLLRPTCFVL